MKTIASTLTKLIILLTCISGFGPAAFGQNTNTPAIIDTHVNQKYNHKQGSVTYYFVFAPKTSAKETYENGDMNAWGLRILDAIDKEFGDGIFKLRISDNPTPKEKQRVESEFIPRATKVAEKWLQEEGLAELEVIAVFFETSSEPTATSKSPKKSGRSTNNVKFGK